jgi:NADH-quinone oxidoreductase subunit L
MLSSLIAAGAAFIETDIKRILALSTVSQIGYIFLGFSSMSPAGVGGATLFILMHGISKAGLFLCAGIIEHGTHKRDIRELGGLYRTMPFTAVSFFFCALSTIGIPPFGGFFSKFLVILGTAEAGFTTVAALALFIAIMTIFYLFRLFHAIFLGEEKSAGHEGSPVMVGVVVLLAAASLLSGLFVKYPMNVVNAAVAGILGVAK